MTISLINEDFQLNTRALEVLEEFNFRYNEVESYVENIKKKKQKKDESPILLNFSAFLLHQSNIKLSKLHILDVSLRSKINNNYSLHELFKDNKFYAILLKKSTDLIEKRVRN